MSILPALKLFLAFMVGTASFVAYVATGLQSAGVLTFVVVWILQMILIKLEEILTVLREK